MGLGTRIALFISCIPLAALLITSAGATVFHDDFDGAQLDPAKWSVQPGGGAITVQSGRARLSAPNGAVFPFVSTLVNPFPTTGDFFVRVGFRYVSVGEGGNGFGSLWYLEDPTPPVYIWQDVTGMRAGVGALWPHFLAGPGAPDTSYHVYEWSYIGGVYSFYLDGTLRVSSASDNRPVAFFFGHHPTAYSQWTSQEIDFVHIESIAAPPGP